ncbi:MAG: GNAT family N-acetyltransferase [Bacteroidaceae bacterium]|nr:GNAT family N-acetyltransferase [Bacteroidaceae bacterium]
MVMEQLEIFELKEACSRYVEPINRLLAQLSSSGINITLSQLQQLVESSASHLFLAKYKGKIVAMLTLGEYLAPTGRKMWIEDVVVDETARGLSIGRAMVEHAIAFARGLGDGVLMLTSRPSRVAANALYRSCNFEKKETNVYKMNI